jgi:hypothetical protein
MRTEEGSQEMSAVETTSRRRRVADPRNISIAAMLSAKEAERLDRVAKRLGWTRSRLVAECVALALGSPGDGRVCLDEVRNPALPGMGKPFEESDADEGGPP